MSTLRMLGGEQEITAWETRSRGMILGFASLILVALVCAVGIQVHLGRLAQQETLVGESRAKVRAYEQALARQIEVFDAQLQALQYEWRDGPEVFERGVAELRRNSTSRYPVGIGVADAHGRALFLDIQDVRGRFPPFSVAGRDYYEHFAHAAPPGNQLYIGQLVMSRFNGHPMLSLARPLHNAEGVFSGIVFLIVYPETLASLSAYLDLDEQDRLVLLDRAGHVVTSQNTGLVAGDAPPDDLRPRDSAGVGAVTRGTGVQAWGTLRDYPFTIVLHNSSQRLERHMQEVERSYLLFTGLPMLGMLACVALLLRDVRQRARVARALVRSELLKTSVVDSMADGILRVDRGGIIRSANGAAARILGITQEHLLGMSVVHEHWPVIYPDGRECPLEELPASVALRTGVPQENIALGFLRPDGGRVWLNVSARGLPAEVGGGVLISFADVTLLMDAVLEASLGSAVVQAVGQAVVVTDRSGIIVRVNPAFEALYGYTSQEAVGRRAGFYRADRHDKTFYQRLWATLAEQGHWEGEVWNRHRNGEAMLVWVAIAAIRDSNGQIGHYVAIYQDITEKRRAEDEMWFGANHDALTRLPNRRLFLDRLDKALAVAGRGAEKLGVLFIDLDRFKPVNDTYGHAVGDALLVQVAQRLAGLVRETDTVARLAGDEFVILLTGVTTEGDVRRVAEGVVSAMAQPFVLEGLTLSISASVGVVLFPDHGHNMDTLLRAADQAMYQAKAGGRNGYTMGVACPSA